jgi:hypothetical protein
MVRTLAFALVACALMGASFGFGLYSGAERTSVFVLLRDVKGRIQQIRTGEAPPAAVPLPQFTRLYDDESIASAQKNAAPSNVLEWAGFYRMVTSPKDLDGLEPLNPWLPPLIHDRLQPWARAKAEATDGIADDTGAVCQPAGWFRATGFNGGFMLIPRPTKIVIAYADIEMHGVQRVYMNRTHPAHVLPTWNGDSIGYWDGDTLVVDTVGFNDKSWLQSTMEPHTEETRVLQRIRRVREGAFLEVHYVIEDRKALTSAYAYTRYFRRVGDTMPENVCNDDLQIWRDYRNEALKGQLARAREVRNR